MKHTIRRIATILLLAVFLGACANGAEKGQTGNPPETTVAENAQEREDDEEADPVPDEPVVENKEEDASSGEKDAKAVKEEIAAAKEAEIYPAPDFTLTDQYGATHTLSDYRGQVVFLNFWATWCPPCRAEMPDIQKLYEEYQSSGDDSVVILGIAAPGTVDDRDAAGVSAFLQENGYTYPVVMDLTGEMFEQYYIMAYPTTFMIDANGNIFGYVQGMMTEEVMRDIIAQTLTGTRTDG